MRNWQWFLGASIAATAAAFAACGGGTESSNNGGPDAGTADSTPPGADSSADAGASVDAGPAVDSSVPCVFPDASLSSLILPDAALDDAGASIGKCVACAKTSCGAETTACSSDCVCDSTLVAFYSCLAAPGGSLQTCGASLAGAFQSSTTTRALGTCVLGGCSAACGFPNLGGGTDAGGADAGKPADSGSADAKTD